MVIPMAMSDSTIEREAFIQPFNNSATIPYFKEIAEWHGYIRLLGLPQTQDNPDISIERLFVEPSLTEKYVSAEAFDEDQTQITLIDAFKTHARIIVLGDPGTGKSTLADWLVWQFTRPLGNIWTETFGALIPLPMVLREMRLTSITSWEDLLSSFLLHSKSKALRSDPQLLTRILATGQALIILDGLDEIGSAEVRSSLKAAVWDGINKFPKCRWLLTSRIVGYEQVPFHEKDCIENALQVQPSIIQEVSPIKVLHISPFSLKQIDSFARDWFSMRQTINSRKNEDALRFVSAIKSNRATLRLARVPNLLAMMALIFRNNVDLPFGRALLYERISEAYLESIDRFRGITALNYSLIEKRRWLSYVAMEMQLRRSGQSLEPNSDSRTNDILFGEDEVKAWLASAMAQKASHAVENSAAIFLDYVARRSGLFLPRGDRLYAFVHLSFQEFYAAHYLADRITSPQWLRESLQQTVINTGDTHKVSSGTLKAWVHSEAWRETFLLLFEILSTREGWSDEILNLLFGSILYNQDVALFKSFPFHSIWLLALIALDPHSGLSSETRRYAWRTCWRYHLTIAERETFPPFSNNLSQMLLTEGDYFEDNKSILTEEVKSLTPKHLHLTYRGNLSVLSEALSYKGGSHLVLQNFSNITNLSSYIRTNDFSELTLHACAGLTDLKELRAFSQIKSLNLMGVPDLLSLDGIEYQTELVSLAISMCEKLRGFEALQFCSRLERFMGIFLDHLSNLAFLSNLSRLDKLILISIPATDFSVVSKLKGLSFLSICQSNLEDISFCSELSSLEAMALLGCPKLKSISALTDLPKLEMLSVSGCDSIKDYTSLLSLRSLATLMCDVSRIDSTILSELEVKGIKLRPISSSVQVK